MRFLLSLFFFLAVSFVSLVNCQQDDISFQWEPPQQPQNPNYLYCSSTRPKKCQSQSQDTVQDFVCGIKKTDVPKTYRDSCRACKDSEVFAFLPGSCESRVAKCPEKRVDCEFYSGQFKDSCVFQSGKAPTNASNDLCCKGQSYTHSIEGTCPPLPETKCRKTPWVIDVLESCPYLLVSRVCGKKSDGKKNSFENSCWACRDRDIVSYTEGPCPSS